MSTCSRCGADDDRHSVKCYQAMALGWAMGVETRPNVAARLVSDGREGDAAYAGRVRDQNLAYTQENLTLKARVAQLEAENASLRALVEHMDQERVQHPPGVTPERLAEIEREVEALDANPNLHVVIHDELNATVTPKPIDLDNEVVQGMTVSEVQAVVREAGGHVEFSIEPLVEPETPPAPGAPSPAVPAPEVPAVPQVTPSGKARPEPGKSWQEANAEKIGVPGAWAQPQTLAAEAAAQEFVDQCLVAADGERAGENGRTWGMYVTAPELVAGYETWAKAHDKPIIKGSAAMVGKAATKSKHVQAKRQGPVHDGRKPNCYFGVKLVLDEPQAAVVAPAPEPVDPTERIRKLMAAARTVKTETIPEPAVDVGHGPDELAIKLAQLKIYGIGGEHGVSRPAAQAAVADLHPTGRDIWKWSPPESTGGTSDADLDATAYQLLVKCMSGLPEEYGFDYKEDVLATAGFQAEDVEAALRKPHRVEIRPESWEREKRYPILGFYRGDVSVILGMRTPSKPRVIAAYWTSLLSNDTHRVTKTGGGGSKGTAGLPTAPGVSLTRLRDKGCEIPEPVDEKPVEVTYKGQSLGKIMTARTTTKITVQADYQRTLRKMQAIDRRQEAKVG